MWEGVRECVCVFHRLGVGGGVWGVGRGLVGMKSVCVPDRAMDG